MTTADGIVSTSNSTGSRRTLIVCLLLSALLHGWVLHGWVVSQLNWVFPSETRVDSGITVEIDRSGLEPMPTVHDFESAPEPVTPVLRKTNEQETPIALQSDEAREQVQSTSKLLEPVASPVLIDQSDIAAAVSRSLAETPPASAAPGRSAYSASDGNRSNPALKVYENPYGDQLVEAGGGCFSVAQPSPQYAGKLWYFKGCHRPSESEKFQERVMREFCRIRNCD